MSFPARLWIIFIAVFTSMVLYQFVLKPYVYIPLCLLKTEECIKLKYQQYYNSILVNAEPSGYWVWFNGEDVFVYGINSGKTCIDNGYESAYVIDAISNKVKGYMCVKTLEYIQNLYNNVWKSPVQYDFIKKENGNTNSGSFTVYGIINHLSDKGIININAVPTDFPLSASCVNRKYIGYPALFLSSITSILLVLLIFLPKNLDHSIGNINIYRGLLIISLITLLLLILGVATKWDWWRKEGEQEDMCILTDTNCNRTRLYAGYLSLILSFLTVFIILYILGNIDQYQKYAISGLIFSVIILITSILGVLSKWEWGYHPLPVQNEMDYASKWWGKNCGGYNPLLTRQDNISNINWVNCTGNLSADPRANKLCKNITSDAKKTWYTTCTEVEQQNITAEICKNYLPLSNCNYHRKNIIGITLILILFILFVAIYLSIRKDKYTKNWILYSFIGYSTVILFILLFGIFTKWTFNWVNDPLTIHPINE
jgi:hypothetical protein